MKTAKRSRQVNMELLRIVSMLLIVFLHSIDHSGVLENAESAGLGMYFYVRLTYMLCQVCVNLYVMLSGYFMVRGTFRLQKLAVLWMETAFYSFLLKLVFMLTGAEPVSAVSLVSCFVPFLTGRYWFLTIYVGMYLVSPFLNILIRAMDKKQHSMLNLCLFGIMSLWVSIHPSIAGMNSGGGWGLAWFVVLYLAAAWLRLYYHANGKYGGWIAGYVAIALAVVLLQMGVKYMQSGLLQRIVGHWFRYDSTPVYTMSICLFLAFLNVEITGNRFARAIQTIAPLTLGVYLIHAHANVSPWSWELLRLPEKMGSPLFPLVQLGSVILIFAACAAVDALRRATVGRLENSCWINVFCENLQTKITQWCNRLS